MSDKYLGLNGRILEGPVCDRGWIQHHPDLHHETRRLVDGFAQALSNKLYVAQQKYGYTDGWKQSDWMDECRQHLQEHLVKGDPRDVANYCAFLWWHGEKTTSEKQVEGIQDSRGGAALAAIQFALDSTTTEGLVFLNAWIHG